MSKRTNVCVKVYVHLRLIEGILSEYKSLLDLETGF